MESQVTFERYIDALNYHFSPLLKYFDDDSISDIEVNDDGRVWAHHIDGTPERLDIELRDESIEAVAALLASMGQNDISDKTPFVSAVYPDPPYRVEIILPKAVQHPAMTIRRFSKVVYPLEHFIKEGTLTEEQAGAIRTLISARKNIIISGETGSGKTTLLNSLLREIPEEDRLFIIEDTKELRLEERKDRNATFVLTGNDYTPQQAVKNAMRMRPDRIIVGEVRDGAALDLLKAWNTGHPGGLASIHANSPETVKLRLRSLIQEVSVSSQQDLIDAAVDAVVQITLCKDGVRRVSAIKTFKE